MATLREGITKNPHVHWAFRLHIGLLMAPPDELWRIQLSDGRVARCLLCPTGPGAAWCGIWART